MSKLSLLEIAQSQLDKTPVIDGQLIVCLDTGNAYRDTTTAHVKIGSDLEVVSDLPLAPLAEKIYYLKPDKLYSYLGGNWTLLNDKTIDLDEVIAKLPAGSSTSLNDDVEIIAQDTDITQSHYYRRKLVALWEYIKTKAQDFFAAKNHKHGKADITDFPASMPASDVYPWAKAATKPSYTKAEVGLGKVDNTADADKTVKRATTAGTADSANSVAWGNVKDKPTTFPPEAHDHDDRYYTEAEIDGKLEKKSPTDHTHDLSELISALSVGNSTTLNDSVQIITQDTNTANQKYYRRPLTVLWNYIKSKADSVYSAIGHTHKIQNLEDYTTRVYDATIVRPADTVLASPQDKDGIATFRKLDKNDVGLENVDNTADKNKNVATAGIATTGVRDYNNANNIIKIGWSGTELDADSLTYVAGYTSDKKIHPASKDGVRSWLGLGDSAYKNTKSRSSKGSTDWTNNATDDAIVPTMSFMAYWDGAYNSNGASNLSYCDRGRFGTIVTKNTGDYAVAGHTHNYAGSGSAGGSANSAVKLDSSAGSNTQPVYFSDGKPVVIGYTIASSVPANAKFTDTTYGVATASSNGLMSSTDKIKLDDFSRVISIQKQIKLTTDWQDTGIAGTSLDTGTYVVQVSGFNSSYTSLYGEIYSGIMTWYSDGTNSGNSSEIFLHNAGHADNNNAIYLRTLRTARVGSLKLQIACKTAATGTDTLTFKFRRLI